MNKSIRECYFCKTTDGAIKPRYVLFKKQDYSGKVKSFPMCNSKECYQLLVDAVKLDLYWIEKNPFPKTDIFGLPGT